MHTPSRDSPSLLLQSCPGSNRGLLSLTDAEKCAEADSQNPDPFKARHLEASVAENMQSTSQPQQGRYSTADHETRFVGNTRQPVHCLRPACSLLLDRSVEQFLLQAVIHTACTCPCGLATVNPSLGGPRVIICNSILHTVQLQYMQAELMSPL